MAITIEELEEFVDSLFVMNYMSEDDRDSVRYHVRENKMYDVINKVENMEKSYSYSKKQEYLLRVDMITKNIINTDSDQAAVRFVAMKDMIPMASSVTTDKVKLSCNLTRINVDPRDHDRVIVNARGTRESCKEYISYIITQIEKYNQYKSNLTYNRVN